MNDIAAGGIQAIEALLAFFDAFQKSAGDFEDEQMSRASDEQAMVPDETFALVKDFIIKQGLEPIGEGDTMEFDPAIHDATDALAPGAPVETIAQGWRWRAPDGDIVLRKASVRRAKDPSRAFEAELEASREYRLGPQRVGGRYRCGYWGMEYTVIAINEDPSTGCWSITVQDDVGTRTHCTPWAYGRGNRVISQPE
ncbi:hypothetical protein ACQPYK_49695 (plasmid) [Streptosporangium sp. CA-135522]|uniref:hypothetical protein n=1 Tax=Streptosporangium sp. CA-135522 TaxID=3240072 RepID=UPI003D8F3737